MQARADRAPARSVQRSIHTSIRRMGAGQGTNGSSQNCVVQRRRVRLFLWNKSWFLAPPSFRIGRKRVASLSCKCHPMLWDSAFWPVLIDRDKAKSRRFSKSKIVCAGWSGKVPRLCAIWTPQCGGMKGKLCFIKRKSKNLVSNDRRFVRKMFRFL